MGVLPLEFTGGETRHTHQIDGTETFTVEGSVSPGAALTVRMTRTDGSEVVLNVKVGSILPRRYPSIPQAAYSSALLKIS